MKNNNLNRTPKTNPYFEKSDETVKIKVLKAKRLHSRTQVKYYSSDQSGKYLLGYNLSPK